MQQHGPLEGFGARPLLAVTLKMISVAVFVGMSTSIKLAGLVPAGQIVFFRSLFAVVPIFVFLIYQKQLSTAFRTERPVGHILRGIVGVSSMYLGFFALTRLPLPEVITLNYAQPLIVVAFSALFLGENVRVYRWTAVVIGLVGVVIIAWPKLTLFAGTKTMESGEAMGVLALLVSAIISAVAMLLVRQLVLTEKSATIVLWFSITCAVAGLASLPFGWADLSALQVVLLITAGLCGGVGQILMTESYRHGDMSIIAPFEYTSMLLGIVVGYFVFNDVPTIHMIVGGAIVVGAGIFIIWREHQLGLERGKARRLVPPQG
jgi:drug/metabolite transporter (DMT)-like permease